VRGWALAVDIGTSPTLAAIQEGDSTRIAEFRVPSSLYPGDLPRVLEAIAGESAGDGKTARPARLVLVVPAGWAGPELAVAGETAAKLGFPDPEFVAQPIAAASYLGQDTTAGQVAAVLGLRPGRIDTAVVRRTRAGFELAGPPGGLAMDGESGSGLDRGALELLATVTAADCAPADLAAVYITGPPGEAALAAGHVQGLLGIEPQASSSPQTAAVLGALAFARPPVSPVSAQPGIRRLPGTRGLAAAARRGWVMYTCLTLSLAALAGAGVTLALVRPGPAGPAAQPTAVSQHEQYQLTMRTVSRKPAKPVSYTMRARYPVVTGLSDAGLQRRVNAELRAPVTRQLTGFAKLARSYSPGSSGAFLDLTATVYRVKDILSVKYFALSHNAGAGDVSYDLTAVTIQLGTGRLLGVTGLLTPAALAAPGQRTLAADLQAQASISDCDTQPGWSGESSLVKALAEIRTAAAVVLNVTPRGLAFSFQDDAISGTVCHPVGVLPFGELSGLISPSFGSGRPGGSASPSASTTPSGRVTPGASSSVSGPASPAAVVRAYFNAINQGDYRLAWRLGGDHLGQSYRQFAAGFAGTARDIVRIVATRGDSVTIKLTAVHSDGSKLLFTGACTVAGGTLTGSDLQQAP
jgi:hypothetical protein